MFQGFFTSRLSLSVWSMLERLASEVTQASRAQIPPRNFTYPEIQNNSTVNGLLRILRSKTYWMLEAVSRVNSRFNKTDQAQDSDPIHRHFSLRWAK
jgi:hypothetical protein